MVTTRRGASSSPPPDDMSHPRSSASPTPPRRRAVISSSSSSSSSRTPPYLPTPVERICLLLFPVVLLFGTLFSLVNPQTRSARYDSATQSYAQDPGFSPNYFARKSNLFNVLFVKRGWAWTTVAFAAFTWLHPSMVGGGATSSSAAAAAGTGVSSSRRVKATLRWLLVTMWWFLITQWCFGPAIIDRGFRWTGGKCSVAEREMAAGDEDLGDFVTAVACKAAGGQWRDGHDISGHVFLLVLGTGLLMMEVGWPLVWWTGWIREERCVIMADGALKSASVEATVTSLDRAKQQQQKQQEALGWGGKVALGVMGLNVWMLLMTAIYFHTWFEKLTGLLTAYLGLYAVYYVPRSVVSLRQVVGLPGI